MKKIFYIAIFGVIQIASYSGEAKAQKSKVQVEAKTPNAKDPGVKIGGEVTSAFTLQDADLKMLTKVMVTRKDRDNKDHQYSGVSLLSILQKAGATTGKDLRGENLTKYAIVEASDGYQVIFALAELDKEFTDREIILANEMDGKPLPVADGPYRIIVQDEKKPARCIKQVTSITIGFAK